MKTHSDFMHALSPLRIYCSYDLLCHEGISRSLLVFQGKNKPPVYKTIQPPNGQALQKMIVKPEVRSLETNAASGPTSEKPTVTDIAYLVFLYANRLPKLDPMLSALFSGT